MNDRWEYTIPANTLEVDRIKVECKISPGLLTKLVVYYPPGCHGLARCRVFLGQKPVAPRTPAHYLAGNGMAITLDNVNEFITENIPVLTWEVWNVDDTYPHTPWMLAEWISEEEPVEHRIYAILKKLLKYWEDRIG